MLGRCAKTFVACWILAPDGGVYVGANLCMNPQPVCPRLPGEGYEKCKSVCQQIGHAEEVAALAADMMAIGGTAYIYGHTYACDNCKRVLANIGITDIRIIN